MSDDAADLYAQAQEHYQAGKLADAADLYQRVLNDDPTHADALHMLGVVTYQLGQVDAAADLIEQAIAVRQPFAEAEANLGTVLMALCRLDDAENTLNLAHGHAPDNPTNLFNLGNVHVEQQSAKNAIDAYEKAVALKPDYAEAWCQLGILFRNAEKLPQALAAYEKAIAAQPNFSQALYNLANVYRDIERFGDAETTLRQAIDARTDYAKAWNSLGTLLGDMGRSDEALKAFDQAVLLAPESAPYASNRLCCLQYLEGVTDQSLADAHTEWCWLHIAPSIEPGSAPTRNRDPDRRLKVGFVSPDFGRHPVGFLSAPLFEHIDKRDFETVVFSSRPEAQNDVLSARIRTACDVWVPVSDLDDLALAAAIDAHQIDILFDLSGQTSGNRLGVFARQPAPIQMSWIGYVGTTGLPTMDYIIGDRFQTPEGSDVHYGEKALRLPDGYACYAPPDTAPDVGPLPAAQNGHITFGCLNNPGKLNGAVIKAFSGVLNTVPDSKLLFRFRGLDDAAVFEPIRTAFSGYGIAKDRLIFEGRAPHAEFLSTYNRVDIALDTFPYSGGLTTCEALWMGVPTVTFPGATFAGRHAVTHLHAAGYGALVAESCETVVARAVALAGDTNALSELRAGMRAQVAASPLCDGPRFAASFATALRTAWQTWRTTDEISAS